MSFVGKVNYNLIFTTDNLVVLFFNYRKGGYVMSEFYNQDDIVIYHDDNLKVLRNLPDKSINLIYCDVLYNSGKKFDDYSDNLGSPTEAIEWYRPRFEEMKRVLTANGSIFIHCNWRLDSYLRILMDEIFGINNFRNRIYRKHSNIRGFYRNFDSQVDIILYYVKNSMEFVFNEYYDSNSKMYPLFENGYVKGNSENRIINGIEINLADKNKHWLVSSDELKNILSCGIVEIIDLLPYRYASIEQIGNLWDEDYMLDPYNRTTVAEAYDTPKPEATLERIIRICSNKEDVIADFFLGGGTTAIVTKKLGRKGIFCDISKKACQVTVDKLKNI